MSDNLLSRNTVLSQCSSLIYCTISTCSCHGLVLLFDFFRVFCLTMWQLNWAGSENQMCFPQAPPVTSVRLWELLVWNPGPWAAGAMPFRYVSNSINIVLFGFKKTVVVLLALSGDDYSLVWDIYSYVPPQGVNASFRSENGYSLRSFWYIPAYPNQNSQVYPRCVFMSSRNAGVLCDDTKKGFVEDYGIRSVARNFPEVRGSFPNRLYTKIR